MTQKMLKYEPHKRKPSSAYNPLLYGQTHKTPTSTEPQEKTPHHKEVAAEVAAEVVTEVAAEEAAEVAVEMAVEEEETPLQHHQREDMEDMEDTEETTNSLDNPRTYSPEIGQRQRNS